MSEWRDEALVLAARPHGESSAILTVFSRSFGLHSGLVRGGSGRRMAAHLQPGNLLDVSWRARLETQLGTFAAEPLRSRAALMSDRLALEALGAITALLSLALPEREPHAALWQETQDLLDQMTRVQAGNAGWPSYYLAWEMRLLEEIGYGLDLSACAVTGARDGLAFVSPKTGRAVTQAGAGDWAARLLPLPPSLVTGDPAPEAEILAGLTLTGHFLGRELSSAAEAPALPAARGRFVDLLTRQLAATRG